MNLLKIIRRAIVFAFSKILSTLYGVIFVFIACVTIYSEGELVISLQ